MCTCKLLFKSPIFTLYDPYIPDLTAPMLKKKKEEKLSFLKNLLLLAKFKKKNQRLEAAVLIQIIFLQFYKYGSGQARNKF